MVSLRLICVAALLLVHAAVADDKPATDTIPVGGANSPQPSPPHQLVIECGELSAGDFAIKVPTGTYTAPVGGAPNYSVPGPIVAFKGADGVWRGHGYLETYPRLLKFTGTLDKTSATLDYRFEEDKSYQVKITVANGVILLDETSNLGPRNVYVLDCFYGGDAKSNGQAPHWLPSAGFVTDLAGSKASFVYLPCYYDKPEVTLNPAAQSKQADAPKAGAVAVTSDDARKKDVAGFWCRDVQSWTNGDRMGIQLWQHRQLPGDPASRHFLGPETKSDSTPNPRTAPLLGKSLYEGHVTIELSLGQGTRKLGFAATDKGPRRETISEAFQKVVAANQK
jgi:hypothetical protein